MTVSSQRVSIEQMRRLGVLAVIRAPDVSSALAGVEALVAGGIKGIEITYSTPDAPRVIAEVRSRHDADVIVGAGTLTTSIEVNDAVGAGAQFLVSPGTHPVIAEALRDSGTLFALGALTPSEVMVATAYGADAVKIFPGSLGGPAYLRALRGPFPDVPFMPTGGVTVENAPEWLDAGAVCLGAGGDLVSSALLAAGNFAEITRRAERFVARVGDRA